MDVGTNYLAAARGLGPTSLDEIEVVGEPIEAVKRRFKKPQIHSDGEMFVRIRMPIHCDPEKCVSCGVCAEVCPVGAIQVHGVPEFDYTRCIQCFCCAELCPQGALKPIRPDE